MQLAFFFFFFFFLTCNPHHYLNSLRVCQFNNARFMKFLSQKLGGGGGGGGVEVGREGKKGSSFS